MKRIFLVVVALLLSASAASAKPTTQKWTAGWDIFSEPLNYTKSKISWSVNPTKSTLSVTFTLVGATPSKLYEVAIDFVCTTFAATFGQFPVVGGGGTCQPATRQGVTENLAGVVLGVVTTDMNGNGSFTVVVGPIAAGTYVLEFIGLNGAGCDLIGGGGTTYETCAVDFQSPGPTFGDITTITIP